MVTVSTSLIDGQPDFDVFDVVHRAQTTSPTPTAPGAQTVYQVVAVDCDGSNPQPLAKAKPIAVRWPGKNLPMEVDLSMSIDDPTFSSIDPRAAGNREVQVYRNGHMLFWGKPVTRRANSKDRRWTITCKDPLWYFTKRNVGRANRVNYLTNGSFEGGGTAWFDDGAVTFSVITGADAYVGTKYARLVGSGQDGHIFNRWPMRSGPLGLAVFLTVWRKVEVFTSPAGFNLGVVFEREGATGPGAQATSPITAQTPRGVYERVHLVVNMPPNVTEHLRASFFVGVGENHYDAATATVEESCQFLYPGAFDQALIISQMVRYAQGTGPLGVLAPEKSDLHVGVFAPPTGIKKRRLYMLADHAKMYTGGQGNGVLDEFLTADDGVDCRIESTPTTKTLRTYYPRFAPQRLDLPLVWRVFPSEPGRDASVGIVGWDYGDSLEPSANQVCILGGWGTSDDAFASREEGGYSNPSSLGGLTLELVDTAPDGAPIGALQSTANGKGAQLENPITTPTFTVKEPRDPVTDEVTAQYIGVLVPGMIVPLDVQDGTVVLEGLIALSSVGLDCASDTLAITVDA